MRVRPPAACSSTNQSGNTFLPQTAEILSYDADGNLTSDGRWAYVWDAENRLLSITSPDTAPSGSRKALHFGYDPKNRRISKVVSNWTGTAWSRMLDEKYIYDGWNLVDLLNGTNHALLKTFVWGLDLSGKTKGAGGVGGLLAANVGDGVSFAAFDANGNLSALINAGDGTTSAHYEYGGFGELICITGPMAQENPFRFSSKYYDYETDLLYYGHRYQTANTGRWLSRDPIGELGGLNLYGFVGNTPQDSVDAIGLASIPAIWKIIPVDIAMEIYFAILDIIVGETAEKKTITYDVFCPSGCSRKLLKDVTTKQIEYVTLNIGSSGAGSIWDFDWRDTISYIVSKQYGCCQSQCWLISDTTPSKKTETETTIVPSTKYDIYGKDGWVANLMYSVKEFETIKEQRCIASCAPVGEFVNVDQ